LPQGWYVEDGVDGEEIQIFQITHNDTCDEKRAPIIVAKSLLVMANYSWVAHVYDHRVPASAAPFSAIPEKLSSDVFRQLLELLLACSICQGNNDSHFLWLSEQKKGKFLSAKRHWWHFLILH
jgi:hypothetical protein